MLLVLALASTVVSAPGTASARDCGHCDKRVSFVGFSANDATAAWRLDIERSDSAGRFVDHFSLVRLEDADTAEVLGTFRASKVVRTDPDGQRLAVPAAYLALANPAWRDAAPEADWKALRREAGFAAQPISAENAVLGVDADADATLRVSAHGDAFYVEGDAGRPLGYVLTLSEGGRLPLGRFRQAGAPGRTVDAKIRVVRSPSGRHVAVLNRFEVRGEGHTRSLSFGKVVRLDQVRGAQMVARARWGRAVSEPSTDVLGLDTDFSDDTISLAAQLSTGAWGTTSW